LLLASWQTSKNYFYKPYIEDNYAYHKNLQKVSLNQYQLNAEFTIGNYPTTEKWVEGLLVEKLSKKNKTNLNITFIEPKFILPVTITSQNIIDFFDMAFPRVKHPDIVHFGHVAYSFQKSPCFFTTIPKDSNTCLIINSIDEYRQASLCIDYLSEIDFNTYTLIIGITWLDCGSFILEHKIIEDDDLTLCIEISRGAGQATSCLAYYWGLYPKLSNKPFRIKHSTIERL